MKITKSILTAAVLTAVSASVFAAETTLPSTVNTDTNGTTIGVNNSIAGKNNIAVGVGNNITGRNSVAIGYHNTASAYKMPADDELIDLSVNPVADGVGSTAIGSFSKVYNQLGTAIGYNASVTSDNNVAVGSYSTTGDVHATDNKYAGVTNNRGVVSIGSIDPAVNLIYDDMEAPEKQSWQDDFTRQIQRVSAGEVSATSTDAVNGSQLQDAFDRSAVNATNIATNAANIIKAKTTVSGSGAVEVTTSTNSNGSTNYNVSLNTDGIREIAKTSNRYAGDDVIKVNRWNNPTGSADLTTFKFDANEAAKVVPITYKANGENAQTTTASKGLNFVDGNHINASVDNNGVVKFDLDKSVTDRIDSNTNSIKANADAIKKLTAANTANLGGLTDKVNTLSSKVDENQREARRGIASASALAALHPLDYDPTHKVDVMAGVGHYRGNTAVALGAAYRPNENMMFTVGASINGKDSAINAGVSYKVGTKEGVESKYSKVAMQRHIDELNTTVAEQNQKIEQLNNLVEKLLEEVHQSK